MVPGGIRETVGRYRLRWRRPQGRSKTYRRTPQGSQEAHLSPGRAYPCKCKQKDGCAMRQMATKSAMSGEFPHQASQKFRVWASHRLSVQMPDNPSYLYQAQTPRTASACGARRARVAADMRPAKSVAVRPSRGMNAPCSARRGASDRLAVCPCHVEPLKISSEPGGPQASN